MKFSALILGFILACDNRAFAKKKFDAIIVGAGASGCPLAQTLAEGGLKTLLIERGPEKPLESSNKADFAAVLRTQCVESFNSKGVVVSTGKCMGGATSFNQGVFIEETSGWFMDNLNGFFNQDLIREAYTWVREQVAPEAATQQTTQAQMYTQDLIEAMVSQGFPRATVDEAIMPEYGVWRPHTIFSNTDGTRWSADTLLDRANPNLVIMTNAEVDRVTFTSKGNKNFAECVKFVDGSPDACIRNNNGRIYLSAGAFHTPELLMKSGISDGGEIFDNPKVGKNLSDKPATSALTFFKPQFGYNEITLADVAANKQYQVTSGEERNLLFEDLSVGGAELLDLIIYEQAFVPRDGRFTPFVDDFTALSDCCIEYAATGAFPQQCSSFEEESCNGLLTMLKGGCLGDASFTAAVVASPASTGSVSLDTNGQLQIDVNYLSDAGDIEAFGEAARTIYKIKSGMNPTKPSFPVEPNPNFTQEFNSSDISTYNCANLYQIFADDVAAQAGIQVPTDTPSTVQPNVLEFLIDDLKLDNCALGASINSTLLSPHHFAGTARVGDVVNKELKVLGANNLYIADASVLPKTPRVNSMATTMMIGRIAGMDFVDNIRRERNLRGEVNQA